MPRDRSSRAARRRGLGTLVLLLSAVATGCGHGSAPEGAPPPPAPSLATATPGGRHATPVAGAHARALEVLRQWDARRSAAFAAADAGAVRRLYPPGSPLAAQDLRVLRRYAERGVRLTRVRHQVVRVRVGTSSPRVVDMRVVERLSARARPTEAGAEPRSLATSPYTSRRLRFVRTARDWRLSSVRAE